MNSRNAAVVSSILITRRPVLRNPTKAMECGHFPNEQSALKCLYLVTRSLDPTGQGRARWTMRCKPALNAFAITFAD
jgi:transposase-like protein